MRRIRGYSSAQPIDATVPGIGTVRVSVTANVTDGTSYAVEVTSQGFTFDLQVAEAEKLGLEIHRAAVHIRRCLGDRW